MNNWQQIWSNRKDTLANVDTKNFRAVFAELKRIDGFDSGGLTPTLIDSMIRQHENLSDALNLTGGGCLRGRLRRGCSSVSFRTRRLHCRRTGLFGGVD